MTANFIKQSILDTIDAKQPISSKVLATVMTVSIGLLLGAFYWLKTGDLI